MGKKASEKMMQRAVFMAQPLLIAPRKAGLVASLAAIVVGTENVKGYGELVIYLQVDSDWCPYRDISLAFIA